MIRRNDANDYLLITQNDRAALSGQIAAHWGNKRFAAPEPRDAVVAAAEYHDAAWSLHDDEPTLNARRIPAAFYEMPVQRSVRIWAASVSATVAKGGPMAGLVVSWHFVALAESVPLVELTEPQQLALQDFLAAQRARQADYCQALGLSPSLADDPPAAVNQRDRRALYNLAVLRACDWISLLLCDNALPQAPGGLSVELQSGQADPILAGWIDEHTLCLDPWPLDMPRLALCVQARRAPGGAYRRNADLHRVLERARVETLGFELVSPST